MEKLPKEFKDKWIAALRSGEYTQCIGRLHDDGGHCCLGVAEIISGAKSQDTGVLIGEFPEAIQFKTKVKRDENVSLTLTEMNDSGKSFPEIADWIEANL